MCRGCRALTAADCSVYKIGPLGPGEIEDLRDTYLSLDHVLRVRKLPLARYIPPVQPGGTGRPGSNGVLLIETHHRLNPAVTGSSLRASRSRSRRLRALSAGVAFAALATSTCVQQDLPDSRDAGFETRLVDGNPICAGCEVTFLHVVTLGGDADPASVWERAAGRGCMVAQLGTGEFMLGGVTGGGEIFVYDDQGRFTGSIGRHGEGPGELGSMARILVGPGDTLWVADDGNVRMQVWTAAGQHIRSFPMPAPYRSFTRLNQGEIVSYGPVRRTGDPMFYIMSPSGEELGRVGTSKTGEPDLEWGVLAQRLGRDSGFWAASMWSYAIKQRDSAGSLEGILVRDVPWFPPYPPYPEEVFESVPPPVGLNHIQEDNQGRLWVFLLLPDPNWRPGIPLSPRPTWQRETFDHLVEVIDPTTARLIVSESHEDRIAPVCNSSLVYSLVEAPSGDLRVRVMEPQIVDADGEPWQPVDKIPSAFERRCIRAGSLSSALLFGRIALLFPLQSALPARRLAALGARADLSTDCWG